MATLADNNAYIVFNGISMGTWFTDETDFNRSNSTVETTAGAGQDWVQKAPGLNDATFSCVVVCDLTDLPTYRAALVIGTKATLVYGNDSNSTGKPKWESSMILTGVTGPNVTIAKDKQMFELEFENADTPTATMEGGSTF